MDAKSFKFHILNGSIASRVLIRSILLACAISIVSLYSAHSLFNLPPIATYFDCVDTLTFRPGSHLLRTRFWANVNCEKDANLTLTVVSDLMGNRLLNTEAKSLCVGEEGSSVAVAAMKQLGFSTVGAVQTHRFEHETLLYEDNSLDFVFSRDLDKVSVPALLVLEVERVLKPRGIGAFLVGTTGSHLNDVIRAATPVSSLLRSSTVVHVASFNNLNLVVFKKRVENATSFYQLGLPADCPSLTFTKPLVELMEPLVSQKQPPLEFHNRISYLPKFVDVSTRKRLVYIDIGTGELLDANVTDWFPPSYPIDQKDFNVYFVHYNTSIMLSYVKRPGITFVYHPGLAGIDNVTPKLGTDDDDDMDPLLGEEEKFDFLAWFKETVHYADFVVLKMNAGSVELKFLSDIFDNGAICYVDELFLKCPERGGNEKTLTSKEEGCMDIYKGLRSNGVYVHQWLGT